MPDAWVRRGPKYHSLMKGKLSLGDTNLSDITDLVARIDAIPSRSYPLLIAIAGAPGSGKSTIAEILHTTTSRPSCVVPMDGFHLDNETLRARDLLHRKGSPQTFDLQGFQKLIVETRTNTVRRYPTFDRHADKTVPSGGIIPDGTELLFVEGNYLLLDEPGWRDLREFWDASIWLDVPIDRLRHRLVQRWIDQGLSEVDARNRAESNDLANADLVINKRLTPTWILDQE